MSNQQEIASLANVSTATVWRVLNVPNSVDPETRKKVEKIVQQVGYRKRQSQKKKTTNAIAFVLPDLMNPFFSLIIKGCEKVAQTHKYNLIISDSEEDVEIEEKRVRGFINTIDGKM